jgi:hypothetical protein
MQITQRVRQLLLVSQKNNKSNTNILLSFPTPSSVSTQHGGGSFIHQRSLCNLLSTRWSTTAAAKTTTSIIMRHTIASSSASSCSSYSHPFLSILRNFNNQRMTRMMISRRRISTIGGGGKSSTTSVRFSSNSSTTPLRRHRQIWKEISSRPIEFISIPCVAAFVGILTNWMGVNMLFYPIQYFGIDLKRWPDTPYGLFGWQGVVPTKTEIMAKRLVKIVTERLLSLEEAFNRFDSNELGRLLLPGIQHSVDERCSNVWAWILRPVLPVLLPYIVTALQHEIDTVLDLDHIVLSAFVRDKHILVDLFQKVGRVELEFLVNSGFGFGLLLGLAQMAAWAAHPAAWTLPAAGALVGYITNWIAIHMIFEPAEPVPIFGGLLEIQGLFESRQVEVSDEFGDFMQKRVLTAASLLHDMASGGDDGALFQFLRRHLPYPIPSQILSAAVAGIADIAADPLQYPELHSYVNERLDIRNTLARRLKTLSPIEFEDMLHPVFQEDEITLIATGGVLGFIAGAMQTKLGWGGPKAVPRAIGTIVVTLAASLGFYIHQKYEGQLDEPLASDERQHLRRRETIVRPTVETTNLLGIDGTYFDYR